MKKFFISILVSMVLVVCQAQFVSSYSESVSTRTVNGKTITERTITQNGKTTIETSVTENGKTTTTRKVINGNGSTNSTTTTTQQPQPQSTTSASNGLSPKDLYVEASTDKKEVYEQEPVLFRYNVYTRSPRVELKAKMPTLDGFIVKELPCERELSLAPTTHNGQQCLTTTCGEYLMFAQKTGDISVPPIEFMASVFMPNSDPFGAFFGRDDIIETTIKSAPYKITVKPLPNKPEGFSGAVGHGFSVTASVTSGQARENETLHLQVKIKGVGNVDLINPPMLDLPASFEQFDAKSTANTKVTREGLDGELTIDYQIIPGEMGKFTLPPVKLIYFDTSDGQYHTVSSGSSMSVNVAKGNPDSYALRERLKNEDIRNIHSVTLDQQDSSSFWMGPFFWIVYILLIVGFVMALRMINFKANRRLDIEGNKRRKATSKANARLKTALQNIEDNKPQQFYAETLKALQHFVADKLAIPVSEVTKDTVRTRFADCGVGEQLTSDFIDIVSDCELHTYGISSASTDEMKTLYDKADQIISQLNTLLKKK